MNRSLDKCRIIQTSHDNCFAGSKFILKWLPEMPYRSVKTVIVSEDDPKIRFVANCRRMRPGRWKVTLGAPIAWLDNAH